MFTCYLPGEKFNSTISLASKIPGILRLKDKQWMVCAMLNLRNAFYVTFSGIAIASYPFVSTYAEGTNLITPPVVAPVTGAVNSAVALGASGEALPAALLGGAPRVRPVPPEDESDRQAFLPELRYIGDIWGILSGAHDGASAYQGSAELTLTVDGELAFGIPGMTIFFDLLNTHGGKLNGFLQSAQGIDNIEVTNNSTVLYQAWIEQNFLADKFSVLAGIYEVNSEFNLTDSSGMLIHPAFGMGSDFAQTGLTGPSTFPLTSLGIRFKVQPTPQYYWMGAVLDAVPGDPKDPGGTSIILRGEEGVLWVTEGGYYFGVDETSEEEQTPTGKLGFGGWGYSAEFDDRLDLDANGDPVQRENRGFYAIFEHEVFRNPQDRDRGMSVFLRYGYADPDINQFEHAVAAGFTYQGLFPSRPDDVLGFGIAAETNGSKFRRAATAAGEAAPHSEIAYELSYQAKINDWLSIQPDLQYVQNHGDRDHGLEDSLVAGVRFLLMF
jgi:porin